MEGKNIDKWKEKMEIPFRKAELWIVNFFPYVFTFFY